MALTSTSSGEIVLPGTGYDILTPILSGIFGSEGLITSLSLAGVLGFLSIIWGIFVVLSWIVSFTFIYLYIYASLQKSKLEEIQDAKLKASEQAYAMQSGGATKSDRWLELQQHIDSTNPNDWKLAIIEADIMLDEGLRKLGYAGSSLGERLKSISPTALSSIDDAWQAHKLRNQIAHGGADFVLTNKLARQTIIQYERVFNELGIL